MIYPYGSIEVEGWEYLYPFSKNAFPSLHPLHSGNGMERILQDLVRVKGRSLPSSPILKANRRTSLLRLVRGNFTEGGGEFDGRYRKGWEIRNYTNAADTILPLRDTPYHAPRHWNDLPRAPPPSKFHKAGDKGLGEIGVSAFRRRSVVDRSIVKVVVSSGLHVLLSSTQKWCRTPWRMDGALETCGQEPSNKKGGLPEWPARLMRLDDWLD